MKKVLSYVQNKLTAGFYSGFALATTGKLALEDFYTGELPRSGREPLSLDRIEEIIRNIANFLIVTGVIVALIFIIWGGLAFMFAGGNTEKAEKAKTRLWNGVIGALIVLGVGLIIRTIETLVTRGFT